MSAYKLTSRMPAENVKHYTAGHVYILDDVSHDDQENTASRTSDFMRHESNCDRVHEFFNNTTAYQVHSVRFTGPRFTATQFMSWWRQELSRRSRNELIIVYFHGKAAMRGQRYQWYFHTRPASINAMEFFEATSNANRDCLYILDCPVATRFSAIQIPVHPASYAGIHPAIRPAFRPRVLVGENSHQDYIIAGQNMLDDEMQVDYPSSFTHEFTRYMASWAELQGMSGRERKNTITNKRYTMPQIMRYDDGLASNTLRILTRRASRGSRRNVYRFCIEVDTTVNTGQLEWVRVRVQGDGNDDSDENEDNTVGDGPEPELNNIEDQLNGDEHQGERNQASSTGNLVADVVNAEILQWQQDVAQSSPAPVQIKEEEGVIEIKDDDDEDILSSRQTIDLTADDAAVKQELGVLSTTTARTMQALIDLTDLDDMDDVIMTDHTWTLPHHEE